MFRNPSYLFWMLAAAAAAAGFSFHSLRARKKITALIGNPATIARLIAPEAAGRRKLKLGLQTGSLVFIFIALAGPQWGVELVPTEGKTSQAVVAVDVSLSMTAEDVKPNRLEKAKGELSLILDQLKGSRVGVIAFAGEAAVLCPVTSDLDAAKQLLGALSVGAIPQPGSAIGKAIRLGVQTLQRYPGGKALIILSDGEDHKTDPLGAAAEAAGAGVKIYAIGIGSPEGEPIPLKEADGAMNGYKKDRKGATVISKLGEQTLRRAAEMTGGAYYRASPGESEAQEIITQLQGLEKSRGVSGSANQYKNRFLFPLWLAFFLLLAELLVPERGARPKKIPAPLAALALIIVLAPAPRAATAEGALRKGNRLYDKEQYVPAIEQYGISGKKNPADPRPLFNAGDALYRLEHYDQAEQAFKPLTDPRVNADVRADAYYNLGNVHFQRQQFKEAVDAYRQGLGLKPGDVDMRQNLAIALRMLKNPPPKKKDQEKDKEKEKDKKDQKPPEQDKQDKGGGQPPEPRTRPQDQLSREDAERLLRAAAEKEKNNQQQVQKQSVKNKPPDAQEDW